MNEDDPRAFRDTAGYGFAEPGGRSALRAGTRRFPCPTCGKPNRLTARDKQLGYQCDACADRDEGYFFYDE